MKSQNLYNYLNFNVTTKENEKKKWDAFGSGHSCSKGRWHYPVQLVLLILIHWIEIYPMNNWGQSNLVSDTGYSDFLFLEKTGLKVLF